MKESFSKVTMGKKFAMYCFCISSIGLVLPILDIIYLMITGVSPFLGTQISSSLGFIVMFSGIGIVFGFLIEIFEDLFNERYNK